MRRFLIILYLTCAALPAQAWNAAGHRLSALIAWQQLSPASREQIGELLARHPDYGHWQEKADSDAVRLLFAEAATWADTIRRDPRYYDEDRDAPTPPIPGLSDQARHRHWHYVDFANDGARRAGEIDRRIEQLSQLLCSRRATEETTWALPWLLHLVGDIHQPMHVGRDDDDGGNGVEIENPARRQPFTNLHQYWDELPGPASLRGKRLESRAAELLARHPAPRQASVLAWRDESHRLLDSAYPPATGSLLPLVTEEFARQATSLAEQRVVAAGYRLGRLLESIFSRDVSRETP